MVAFARALATDARVLILDEPTASLTDTEITELFSVLRGLRDEGVAILYVSHRLEEVFELCDRLTIMRNGETIITKDVADSHIDEVISNMVGRPGGELYPDRTTATDEVALTVERLDGSTSKTSRSPPTRAKCSESEASPGPDAAKLWILSGAQKHKAGTIAVGDTTLPHSPSVGKALDAGIALVPEERRAQGVILGTTIRDNIALANIPAVSSFGVVSGARISDIVSKGMADLQIEARSSRQPVGDCRVETSRRSSWQRCWPASPRCC